MGSKHKNLAGLEETRLLRDFEKYGFDPGVHHIEDYVEFVDVEGGVDMDYSRDGWIMFSPSDANAIYECLEELRLTL